MQHQNSAFSKARKVVSAIQRLWRWQLDDYKNEAAESYSQATDSIPVTAVHTTTSPPFLRAERAATIQAYERCVPAILITPATPISDTGAVPGSGSNDAAPAGAAVYSASQPVLEQHMCVTLPPTEVNRVVSTERADLGASAAKESTPSSSNSAESPDSDQEANHTLDLLIAMVADSDAKSVQQITHPLSRFVIFAQMGVAFKIAIIVRTRNSDGIWETRRLLETDLHFDWIQRVSWVKLCGAHWDIVPDGVSAECVLKTLVAMTFPWVEVVGCLQIQNGTPCYWRRMVRVTPVQRM